MLVADANTVTDGVDENLLYGRTFGVLLLDFCV